jgi:hypothetical protein
LAAGDQRAVVLDKHAVQRRRPALAQEQRLGSKTARAAVEQRQRHVLPRLRRRQQHRIGKAFGGAAPHPVPTLEERRIGARLQRPPARRNGRKIRRLGKRDLWHGGGFPRSRPIEKQGCGMLPLRRVFGQFPPRPAAGRTEAANPDA